MESIDKYIEKIEEILDTGKNGFFSEKISIDRGEIDDILYEMRTNMPMEIEKAKRISKERDKIIKDAEEKAYAIIENAEERAETMVSEHEIYQRALEAAEALEEETARSTANWEKEALEYVDSVLAQVEKTVQVSMGNIADQYENTNKSFDIIMNVILENRQGIRKD